MRKLLLAAAMAVLCFVAKAQDRTITGVVVDSAGSPVPAASVLVKGTAVGTATDNDGTFSISVPKGRNVLVISALGFADQEVRVGDAAANVRVAMKTALVTEIAEVVVTGTGVATNKKTVAIAVESISAKNLPAAPTADIGNALVGKIAGAQISSVNGSPGAPVQILLRGINSVRGGTAPMILLDGVQIVGTGLETLDLANVERVEVVQGPAAATIYGAQGANGVIQLFSKKGRKGRLSIDFNNSVGFNQLLNVGGLQKARKHPWETDAQGNVIGVSNRRPMEFDTETGSYLDNPIGNLIASGTAYNKQYDRNLQWYDHYKMFFTTAKVINNSLSLSGATDKFDFSVIGSNNYQETVFKNNGDFNRSNLSTNIGVELAKGLRLRSITQVAYTRNTQLDPDGRNMFFAINNARPFANFEARDDLGLYSPYLGDAVGVNHYNFNYIIENAQYKERQTDIVQNFNLNYKFPRFVELDAKYGYNSSSTNRRYDIAEQSRSVGAEYWQYWAEFYSPRTSFGAPTTGSESGEINQAEFGDVFQNFLTTATLRFDLKEDFGLNFPLVSTTQGGWDWRKRQTSTYWTYGTDAPDFVPYNASNMANFKVDRDTRTTFATYGYFVNQRFDYNNMAGVSVGFRSDYSSAFGRGSTPFTFPRGDAYVRLSQLGFWQNSGINNFWNEFKVRAAYGEAGIQPGAYDRFPILTTATVGTQSALATPVSNANPDLQVEVAKELEIGFDAGFKLSNSNWFRSANLSFTWWDRTSENVIDQVDVAPSLGIGRLLTNAMTLASNGIQASLNMAVLSSKNINWNFTTNFARQKSIIESVEGNAELIKTSAAGSAQYVLRAGEQIGQLYGYLLLNAVDQRDPNGNFFIPEAQQKDYEVASNGYVVDKATKRPFASAGRYSLGDPNPDFNMSFINDVTVKGFLFFSMQWDWLKGNNVYNQTRGWMYRDGIHQDYDNPITINGQTDAWSAFYRGVYAARAFNGTKNYFMEDASFWRLRNLAIGFDFAKFVNIKGLNRAQLLLTGRNLLTFTGYSGMDPEVSSGALNSGFDRGVDHNTIPNVKTYQIGLNLGF